MRFAVLTSRTCASWIVLHFHTSSIFTHRGVEDSIATNKYKSIIVATEEKISTDEWETKFPISMTMRKLKKIINKNKSLK